MTSIESFEKLKKWVKQIKLNTQKPVKIALCGNKSDAAGKVVSDH